MLKSKLAPMLASWTRVKTEQRANGMPSQLAADTNITSVLATSLALLRRMRGLAPTTVRDASLQKSQVPRS